MFISRNLKRKIQLTLGKGEIGNLSGLLLCLISAFLYMFLSFLFFCFSGYMSSPKLLVYKLQTCSPLKPAFSLLIICFDHLCSECMVTWNKTYLIATLPLPLWIWKVVLSPGQVPCLILLFLSESLAEIFESSTKQYKNSFNFNNSHRGKTRIKGDAEREILGSYLLLHTERKKI